jgi:hypothetical protein
MVTIKKPFFLKRVCSSEQGTFGVFIDDQKPLFVTVELPWRDNKRNISCIPQGAYICERSKYTKVLKSWGVRTFKSYETFEIVDVTRRTGIKFHVANTINDLLGCVGIGSSFGKIGSLWAVWQSKLAFRRFMKRFKDVKSFPLIIENCWEKIWTE